MTSKAKVDLLVEQEIHCQQGWMIHIFGASVLLDRASAKPILVSHLTWSVARRSVRKMQIRLKMNLESKRRVRDGARGRKLT